eukprot:2764507-Prymnesium_polylepis.1
MLAFVTRTPRPEAESATTITWIQKQRVPETTAIAETKWTLKAGSFLTHSRHQRVESVPSLALGT